VGIERAKAHDAKVARIASQLRIAAEEGRGRVRLRRHPTSHFVPIDGRSRRGGVAEVDVHDLDEILEIDVAGRRCSAEPGVTFERLVGATLPLGLMPTCVPELTGITIGGAVSGCSVESRSFCDGGFHDRCRGYEVVTSAGEVVWLTRDRPADELFFEMIHGSYGTIALLTRLEFDLVPAPPFVRLDYRLFRRPNEFWTYLLDRCRRADYDFVDAIVHAPDRLVACLGTLVDRAPYTNRYDGAKIFYRSTRTREEDYLETAQYFFRYDRECHWLSRTAPPLEWRPVRLALGRYFLGSTNIITWAHRLGPVMSRLKRRPDVVVDVFVPGDRFEDFLGWYGREVDHWPLWVVPYRPPRLYPWISDQHQARMGTRFLVDCAIYGAANGRPGVDLSELIERKVHELGGIKTLISRNHYDEETFWSIYSRPRYEAAKARLDPRGAFGDVYSKLVATSR
jgi:FAD/FMN-containing dehydrogenase